MRCLEDEDKARVPRVTETSGEPGAPVYRIGGLAEEATSVPSL